VNRIIYTIFGVLLAGSGVFLRLNAADVSDWLVIAMVGLGAHFVSKSLLKDAVGEALRLLPWKRDTP